LVWFCFIVAHNFLNKQTISKQKTEIASEGTAPSDENDSKLVSVKYEVFGRVQGVSFRHYTQKKATSLGVKGWVQNTLEDSVIGEAIGDAKAMQEFVEWLSNGPKLARVDKLITESLSNEQVHKLESTDGFLIVK